MGRSEDMIDNSIIQNNPLVPEGFYFAQVVSVESEPSENFMFPKILIHLKLYHKYGLPDDCVFHAILYPTLKSFCYYKNFFNTYLLGDSTDDRQKAVGQWGSVRLSPASFNGNEYSTVHFVYQPLPIRMESWRLGRDSSTS
jgi:hypothetical protein